MGHIIMEKNGNINRTEHSEEVLAIIIDCNTHNKKEVNEMPTGNSLLRTVSKGNVKGRKDNKRKT